MEKERLSCFITYIEEELRATVEQAKVGKVDIAVFATRLALQYLTSQQVERHHV